MYNQKLVASIKSKGKILREFKDNVYVPFGSEYSVLLKNLNTTRAVVNVFIDGENAVPGGLVIDPGRTVDLERWIKNGNLSEGNKFKFIERTGAVEAHRGIKLEDGLIRVEFQFERPYTPPVWFDTDKWKGRLGTPYYDGPYYGTTVCSNSYQGPLRGRGTSAVANASLNNVTIGTTAVAQGAATTYNDAGITVAGSKSDQTFQHTTVGALEYEKHTIVLKLLGETPDNKPVVKEVTVKTKPKCTTCGRVNKHNAKFCTECGTALEIFA